MARPILPRFEITVLKKKSSSDAAQVPTAATIQFYRQGATVREYATLEPLAENVPVSVYDKGELRPNDVVRQGSTVLVVGDVSGDGELLLTNNSNTPLALAPDARLIVTSRRPNAYSDPLGTTSLGSSISANSTTGRASAYLSQNRVDYEVQITGEDTRLYLDGPTPFGRSDQRWTDLRDFDGNLQTAIDNLPAGGGVVFVPQGVWLQSLGVTIEKQGVTILGEGHGSIIRAATPNSHDLITVREQSFQMQDLTVDGAATSYDSNGKSCVVVRGLGDSGNLVINEFLQNVRITGGPRYGLLLRDVLTFVAEGCQFDSNQGTGVRIEKVSTGANVTQFIGCSFSQNGRRGCEASLASLLTFLGCSFEGNGIGSGDEEGNALDAVQCNRLDVLSSHFRPPGSSTRVGAFIGLDSCGVALVDGCYFDGGVEESLQPKSGVVFKASVKSRLSSCSGQGLLDQLAWFDPDCRDCLEMCNSEAEMEAAGSIVRIKVDDPRFISMSRRGMGVPAVQLQDDRPDSATPGSLVWVSQPEFGHGHLQMWDGSDWRSVVLS